MSQPFKLTPSKAHTAPRSKKKPAVLKETAAQKQIILWARGSADSLGACMKWPELNYLYRIPNDAPYQAKNRFALAAHYRAMGQLPGMPDLCLPSAHGNYFALYLELKREDGGNISKRQKEMAEYLRAEGNAVLFPEGHKEAIARITDYLEMPRTVAIAFATEQD